MVFVTQRPGKTPNGFTPNLQSAAEYGPLEFVFDGDESVARLPGPSYKKAIDKLANFNYHTDYILWPGIAEPAAFFLCSLILGQLNLPQVRFLAWERNITDGVRQRGDGGFYTPVTFRCGDYR